MSVESVLEEAKPHMTDEDFVDYLKEIKKQVNKLLRDPTNLDALDDLACVDLPFFSAECSKRYFTTLLGES
jgi:hypothetical protein